MKLLCTYYYRIKLVITQFIWVSSHHTKIRIRPHQFVNNLIITFGKLKIEEETGKVEVVKIVMHKKKIEYSSIIRIVSNLKQHWPCWHGTSWIICTAIGKQPNLLRIVTCHVSINQTCTFYVRGISYCPTRTCGSQNEDPENSHYKLRCHFWWRPSFNLSTCFSRTSRVVLT